MGLFGKSDKEKEREDIERANEARRKLDEARKKQAQAAPPAPPRQTAPAGAPGWPTVSAGGSVPVSQAAPAGVETYTVVKGDSLSKIAKRHLGSASKWKSIYEANRQTIGDDPDKIFPGQQLRIPTGTSVPPKNA